MRPPEVGRALSRLEIAGISSFLREQYQERNRVVAGCRRRVRDRPSNRHPRSRKSSFSLLLCQEPIGKLPRPSKPIGMRDSVQLLSTIGAQCRLHVIAKGTKVDTMIPRNRQLRLSRLYVETLSYRRIHPQSHERMEDCQS